MENDNKNVDNLNNTISIPIVDFDIKKLLEEITNDETNPMTPSAQLKRLLNTNFISPYEVLLLNPESTDEEIKKQYRQLSLLIHPDKCSDPKASDAFHILETAYKTLQDVEKKKFFQRVIREAKDRVDIERKKENKNRVKKGQAELSEGSYDNDLKRIIRVIIDEIEERKKYSEKMETAHKKRERDEEEDRRNQEELDKLEKKEWESYRDKRVKNWNKFQSKLKNGKRKGKYEMRPPKHTMEERIDNDKIDIFRPNTII
jgi:DnaJ family protein C protein 8